MHAVAHARSKLPTGTSFFPQNTQGTICPAFRWIVSKRDRGDYTTIPHGARGTAAPRDSLSLWLEAQPASAEIDGD